MIAHEGRIPVVTLVAAAVVTSALAGLVPGLLVGILAGLVAWLFRDPPRMVPARPLGVVSPVDGAVRSCREVHDPWLQRAVRRVGILVTFPGMGPLRSPTEGKVMDYRLRHEAYRDHGGYRVPRNTVTSHALWLRTDEGDDLVLVVSSRWRLHRLVSQVRVGERLGQGQRWGFAYLVSRVDVLFPVKSRFAVQPGRPVVAGTDVLATLVH